MDVADLLLEIEALILLRRGHTDITAGCEAPVGRFDFFAVYEFDQPRYGLQLCLREPVLQPNHLAVEISGVLELFHSSLPLFVELLHEAANYTRLKDRFTLTLALSQGERELVRQVCNAGSELVEEIHLFDQTADRFRDRVEGLSRGVLCVVLAGQCFGVLLTEGPEAGEELFPVGLVKRDRLA